MESVHFLVFIGLVIGCKGNEMFAALVDIESLVLTQEIAIESLEEYVNVQQKKIQIISEYLDVMKIEQKMGAYYANYLHNPINAFTLIKRLTHDLQFLESIIQDGPEYYKNLVVKYPSYEDLKGASQGLVRIQRTYELNVTELSKGLLRSRSNENREERIHHFKSMSFDDCYILGKTLYDSGEYKIANRWLLEASNLFISGQRYLTTPYKLSDVLKTVVLTCLQLDDCKSALEINEKIFKESDPIEYDEVRLMIQECEKKEEVKKMKEVLKKNNTEGQSNKTCTSTPTNSYLRYEKFCRGEMDIAPEVKHRLKCRYLRKNNPFLLIAPFKMEELYLQPDVYLIYDVISDHEIKKVKDASRTKFQRAKVRSGNHSEPSTGRVSKTAWLDGGDCDVLDKLFERVTDFSGYNLQFSPLFQIANYGIGGHYDVHFDYFSKKVNGYEVFVSAGNRIATVLIYLTDVEQGGATTFPKLGLTMFPKKGSAVFWKNLHHNGKQDDRMCHGACPVLLGDKWGINLWIREHAQEFLEPCSLDPKKGMMTELLPPVPWTKSFGLPDY